jgi:hypothetical protein
MAANKSEATGDEYILLVVCPQRLIIERVSLSVSGVDGSERSREDAAELPSER